MGDKKGEIKMDAKPYRCPGCGQFEKVVLVDETIRSVEKPTTESTPLRYCHKCRTVFMASLLPAVGPSSPATSTTAGSIFKQQKNYAPSGSSLHGAGCHALPKAGGVSFLGAI